MHNQTDLTAEDIEVRFGDLYHAMAVLTDASYKAAKQIACFNDAFLAPNAPTEPNGSKSL